MAKAPKAPGHNGPGTTETLFDEFTTRMAALDRSGYWRAKVAAAASGPVAQLLGAEAARSLLPELKAATHADTQALGLIAAGLARRGDEDAAREARAEAISNIKHRGVDGELGTLAWCAVARASAALTEDAEVDHALDGAEACARRETSNPTQPWPHWMLALAEHGRHERLAAALAKTPATNISSDIERAAVEGVARAAARCDAGMFERFGETLRAGHGHLLHEGVVRGAEEALREGRGRALFNVLGGFEAAGTYSADAGARVALLAADGGDLALGRELATFAGERAKHPSWVLANVFDALGDADAAERLWAQLGLRERWPLGFHELQRPLRVVRARDSEAARAFAQRYIELARGRQGRDVWEALGEVGVALVKAGEEAPGRALLDEAVAGAEAIKQADQGWSRNYTLQTLGARLADAGEWAPSLAALRKCTSKHFKPNIASHLANAYARAGDPAGVVLALSYAPAAELKGLMAVCDALHITAGQAPLFTNRS